VVIRVGRGRWAAALVVLVVPVMLVGAVVASVSPSAASSSVRPADPASSIAAAPDYLQSCAMSGLDNTPGCLQVALKAIDHARAREGLRPLRLPSDYATLPFAQQMLTVVDAERADRHLPPAAGLTTAMDSLARQGAAVNDLPPPPGRTVVGSHSDALSAFANALDVDYQWLYNDGPGSGTPGCSGSTTSGCWADRHLMLARYPSDGTLVMGAADDPTGDTQSQDKGGPSMAVLMGTVTGPVGPLVYSWAQARAAVSTGSLRPLSGPPAGVSATGIPDPAHTVPPTPDYTGVCASSGVDNSAPCLESIVAAIDGARAAEGVPPMTLPADFAQLSIPAQMLVAVNLERTARGLPAFAGLSVALDANAELGARTANDPPNPGGVIGDDTEWSGGSVNGLDADYGWMYDDGRGSGNLDCPRRGGPGCWGHRHGILDNFGTVGTMVMGAAFDPTGDNAAGGWAGGTSMAITLAATVSPPASLVVSWPQVLTDPPPAALASP
jgi:hypothetical protein